MSDMASQANDGGSARSGGVRRSTASAGVRSSSRRTLRPLRVGIFRAVQDGTNQFLSYYSNVDINRIVANSNKTGKKKKRRDDMDFDALAKSFDDRRDKYGTSIAEDYREDILAKLPTSAYDGNEQAGSSGPTPAWRFVFDPRVLGRTGRPNLVMVETEAQLEELLSRGYVEIAAREVYGRNTSNDELPFPEGGNSSSSTDSAAAAAAAGGSTMAVPLLQRLPPPDDEPAKVPVSVPRLRKEGGGSLRDKLIECFEEKVVDEAGNAVWSPFRRWNKKDFSGDAAFGSRVTAYYAAKKGLAVSGSDTIEKLKKAARTHSDILALKSQCESEGRSFAYFDVCLDLCNNGRAAEQATNDN